MRDVVAKQFESVARKGAEKFAAEVVGEVAQNEVAIAFDGDAAQTPSAVGRKVDAPELALVDEVVDVPLRAPELCRHFTDRQRRPVDEVHRKEGEFKLSGVGHLKTKSYRFLIFCVGQVWGLALEVNLGF